MVQVFRSCMLLSGIKKSTGYKLLNNFPLFSPGARISSQRGFTLIEIVLSMTLMTILMGMSVSALSYYQASRSVDAASREITSAIREAQAMSVTTGNTYRIDFSASSGHTYQLQYRLGGSWVNVRGPENLPSNVTFDSSSLPSFGGDAYLEFYPRGTAESGQLILDGRYGKTKTIQVDGETVNVRT